MATIFVFICSKRRSTCWTQRLLRIILDQRRRDVGQSFLLMTFMVLFKKLMKLKVCRSFARVGAMVMLRNFFFTVVKWTCCFSLHFWTSGTCFAKSWVTEVERLSEQTTMRRVMRWSQQLEVGKRTMVWGTRPGRPCLTRARANASRGSCTRLLIPLMLWSRYLFLVSVSMHILNS